MISSTRQLHDSQRETIYKDVWSDDLRPEDLGEGQRKWRDEKGPPVDLLCDLKTKQAVNEGDRKNR